MTKGRFHTIDIIGADIIGAVAEYVQEKNEEQKNRIIKIAENVKELYFPLVVENVKRAISEHVEEAIYYPYALKHENDAIRKAWREYAGVIEHRFRDISLFCVIAAITKTKTVPNYKTAVNRALKIAEQQIKELKTATDCSVETAYYLAIELIKDVCDTSYDIYHFDEAERFWQFLDEQSKKHSEVFELLTKEADETKRKEYYQQLDELDNELKKAIKQHESHIYRYDEAKSIAANIIARLYPNADKIKEILPSGEDLRREIIQVKKTFYPSQFVIPKDKVSNKLFEGELVAETVNLIATEKKGSKKELTAKVSINFDELEGVQLSRSLEPFDRIVHDAIVTLYEVGNKYMSLLMIYRTITGNERAVLTKKQLNKIAESINKLSSIRITIDANGEAEAYGLDKVIFQGNLLYTKAVYVEHKGQISQWIKVLERPVLMEYAERKGQIDRVDIKMLNTPVNKNEENIILQDYLLRRISAMKKSKISRNILYETIYKQLGVDKLEGVEARKKKVKVRETTKKILDYWKEQGEIQGYKENKGKNKTILSLTITL